MTEDALIEVLIGEIEDGRSAYVNDLYLAARDAILKGNGSIAPLTGGGQNNKTFSRLVLLDPARVARCCRQALASGDYKDVSATSLDFSGLGGGC